ncbi:MAG: VanZ family protein [Candidatus Acidiferrum sp.]
MTEKATGQSLLSYWIPAILIAILISIFSTHYFSDEQTGRVILPALHWLFPWATNRTFHIMHMGIRKMAHITEFGVFSATVFRGVRAGRTGWRISWALATLFIAAGYAGLDELHQVFVPLRDASPRDVAIDTFGALLAQIFVWWYATGKWPFDTFSKKLTRESIPSP